MGKHEKSPVVINGIEYDPATFNEEQAMLLNHINSLDGKIRNATFNLDQMSVGKNAFVNMLFQSLNQPQPAPHAVPGQAVNP